MRDLDVGVLPVCENNQILGMITDRDIVLRAVADGSSPMMVSVRNAMSGGAISCHDDNTVEDAAHVMSERQVRRLIVLDQDGQLCGILSLGDLAVKANDNGVTGEALELISEPGFPARPTV